MLSPGNFKVSIDSGEFANIAFFCTTANVPGLSQASVLTGYKNNNAYAPGDTIDYSTFDVTFIVDEEMKNYVEIFNWISNNSSAKPKYRDVILSILTNKNNINKQVRFHKAFPISLDPLQFTTQDTALDYLTCNVTFQYDKFDFVR